jgi:hypothetical protein
MAWSRPSDLPLDCRLEPPEKPCTRRRWRRSRSSLELFIRVDLRPSIELDKPQDDVAAASLGPRMAVSRSTPWCSLGFARLGKAPADSMTQRTKLAQPFRCLRNALARAMTASFSNFVVADPCQRRNTVRRRSARAKPAHIPRQPPGGRPSGRPSGRWRRTFTAFPAGAVGLPGRDGCGPIRRAAATRA